jgi:fructoselysine 6-kinase
MVKIAAIGDNVVDCYPSQGLMYPGGNCLNVSVFARRFGAVSAYIGAIGKDRAGAVINDALRREGVDVTRLREIEGSTAYCVIGHRGAERLFLASDVGVSMIAPAAEDIDFLKRFDAVHVGQSSGLDAYLPQIAAAARLSYDFSTRREGAHRRAIAPMCFLASLSAGDFEAHEVAPMLDELLGAGAKWALATLGAKGAILANRSERFKVVSAPAAVVDTLGAGDAFIARVLFGLSSEEAPQDILDAAAKAAARTCEYFGAVGHGAPMAG